MRNSRDFFNSIGINTHLNYLDKSYGNVFMVYSQIQALGIKHIRDGFHMMNDDYDNVVFTTWVQLSKIGAKFNAVYDPSENLPPMTSALLNQFWWKSGMSLEAVEGPNELDIRSGSSPAVAAQMQPILYSSAKAMAQGVPTIDVIAPSMANWQNCSQLGDLSTSCDFGNLHAYPGGAMPTAAIPAQLPSAALVCGTKPVIVTETGYHTTKLAGLASVSEAAQGKYIPRILLDNFAAGVQRTYLYELQDQAPPDDTSSVEQHFGLVHMDGSPKPAFIYLSNLISILEKQTTPILQELEYSLSSDLISSLVIQQTHTSWLLFLWQEVPVFDLAGFKDIQNPALSVRLTLNRPRKLRLYDPMISASPIWIASSSQSILLSVEDSPMVIQIG
jgi:hypothetical protein